MNIIIIIFLGLLFVFGLAWHDQPGRQSRAAIPSNPKRHSAAKPQPKERGVYAASPLEVPQPVKREEGLETLNAEGRKRCAPVVSQTSSRLATISEDTDAKKILMQR